MGSALEEVLDQGANFGDASGASDKHDFVDLFGFQLRIFESLPAGSDGAIESGLDKSLKLLAGNFALIAFAFG
jgi:hypothetical protein